MCDKTESGQRFQEWTWGWQGQWESLRTGLQSCASWRARALCCHSHTEVGSRATGVILIPFMSSVNCELFLTAALQAFIL